MAAVELKVGLVIESDTEVWTVLRVYPADVKVEIRNKNTEAVRKVSFRRSKFMAVLADVQAV